MATNSYSWTLTAFQQHGQLNLQWSSSAPFRAEQGQIYVYSGTTFPSNPQSDKKASISDTENSKPWNTGLTWGSDWCCAWIAQTPSGTPYPFAYVVQLVTEGASKPDSTTAE